MSNICFAELHMAICQIFQDNYNEQIDMWSVGCIYAELLQMLATSSTSSTMQRLKW